MDKEVIGPSIAYAVISAIMCGIYLAVVLTNDYLKGTLAAVYGTVIFVAVFVIFVASTWICENGGGVDGCLPRLFIALVIGGAAVAIVYCSVQTFMIADASFHKDEITYEVIEEIPNAWVFAMLCAPGVCGLSCTIGIFASSKEDETSVFWSSFPYVLAYFACAIISLIFSTGTAMLIIAILGGLLAVGNVIFAIGLLKSAVFD